MDWTTVFLIAGVSFGLLLAWVIINYIFLEKDWGDKITLILIVIVLLSNIVFLSKELISEGYWIVVPGLFIVAIMLIAQIWLLQPSTAKE
ncbi:MAG: hypothetical protein KAR35_00620 [Candidatus Heimdallarchaeota archaeon]|nr:hypothetical protein [Candidatus Heimdallarchaeota archaeon]MCK5047855.1 hypothetical protein [Candidatus Heimdallarchaeota archaeon]